MALMRRIGEEGCLWSTHLGPPTPQGASEPHPGIAILSGEQCSASGRSSPHSEHVFVSAPLAFVGVVHPIWTLYLLLSWPVHFLEESSRTSFVFFMTPLGTLLPLQGMAKLSCLCLAVALCAREPWLIRG